MNRHVTFYQSIILALLPFLLPLDCFCYNEKDHGELCTYISDHSVDGFSFDQYLKPNLGFDLGVNHYFTERKVMTLSWFGIFQKDPLTAKTCLGEGGKDEDSPFTRCKNHFHDSLMTWNQAGLNKGEGFLGGESSIIWAQKERGLQYSGDYSWHDVRHYFYTALTSMNADIRAENLIKTFQGVGHLMHLIQDASVPEHIRNNSHILPSDNFEKYITTYNN